jgi:urease accessory protein
VDTPGVPDLLHTLEHAGKLDTLVLARGDLARRKLRACTAFGEEVAIALPRALRLADGSVLRLDERGALVVKVEADVWLRLRPRDARSALALGFHAGSLHWSVRFHEADLLVALDCPLETYMARLSGLLSEGLIQIVAEGRDA